MNRSLIRLTVLTTLVVLGLIAIAQAQRATYRFSETHGRVLTPPADPRADSPAEKPESTEPRARLRTDASDDDPQGAAATRLVFGEIPVETERGQATLEDEFTARRETGQSRYENVDPRDANLGDDREPAAGAPRTLFDEEAAPRSVTDRYSGQPIDQGSPVEPAPLPADPLAEESGAGSRYETGGYSRAAPSEIPDRGELGDFLNGGADGGSTPISGTARPGDPALEGRQAPALVILKTAPEEVQIGKPAVIEIRVANNGAVAAHNVEIRDDVPRGARLMSTTPPASTEANGRLAWALGTLEPGEEATVRVRLMPTTEGEIGSVATVSFSASASARSLVTRPALKIALTAPDRVMAGDQIALDIEISNPGTGAATGIVLEETVPDGFEHPAGRALEYEIGTLKPGEVRRLQLAITATAPGLVTNLLTARGDGDLQAEEKTKLEVVAPDLQLAMEGSKRRFLDRQATYTVLVSNPGTAAAEEIELVTYLPPGMKFISANNAGQYDPQSKAVYWLLEELPANETSSVTVTAIPTQAGPQSLRIAGKARRGLSDEAAEEIMVEGVAALLFQLADVDDPIEVGGETNYEIRVVNQGSKAAGNVKIVATLDVGMRAISADGPTPYVVNGQRVEFEALPRLAPRADTTYRLRAEGLRPGDMRLRVELLSDELESPVTKEESTRIFGDE